VGVEGNTLLSSTGLGNGQADTENGVGTKLGLVGGSIEVDQELVNLGLVLDIDVLLDESRGDDLVDILDSLEDTLATPLGLVTVTELASLVLTCPAACQPCVPPVRSEPIGRTNRWRLPKEQLRGEGPAR
jgi:hypothetical protein